MPETPLIPQARRMGARCTVSVLLESIENAQEREWLDSIIDGTDPDRTTPADAALIAEKAGKSLSAAIVRRHRRRLVGRGEKCWCPE